MDLSNSGHIKKKKDKKKEVIRFSSQQSAVAFLILFCKFMSSFPQLCP